MTGTGRRKPRIIRQKMITADPHCWYCGVEVVEVRHRRGARPGNAATVEHLFHRLNGPRPDLGALVLACNDCNNERNRYSEQLAGIDLLRQRARMHPCACGCGGLARSDFPCKRGHEETYAQPQPEEGTPR